MINNIKLPPQEWLGYDPERGDIHGYTFEQMREFAELLIQEVLAVQENLIAEGHNAWHLNGPTKKYFGVE